MQASKFAPGTQEGKGARLSFRASKGEAQDFSMSRCGLVVDLPDSL